MCTLFQSLSFKQTQAGSQKESMVEAEKEEGEEEGGGGGVDRKWSWSERAKMHPSCAAAS